jgi:hypothetical protein
MTLTELVALATEAGIGHFRILCSSTKRAHSHDIRYGVKRGDNGP